MSAAALQSLASAAAATIYDAIGVARTNAELDDLIKLVWRGSLDGAIDDADAMHLHVYADQRRQRFVPMQPVVAKMPTLDRIPIAEPNLRRVGSRSYRSRFSRRREQRSPDKQASYDRRHRLAYSGVLPRHLAPRLTIGEMAVMRIIADEYTRAAGCELSLAALAARAGVCRKMAKRAMQKARAERLISIEERLVRGQRHKPNFIRIISFEWLKWLRRGKDNEANARSSVAANVAANCGNDVAADCGNARQEIAGNDAFRGPQTVGGGGHSVPPTDTTLKDDHDPSVVEFRKTEPPPDAAPPQGGQPTKEAIAFADDLAIIAGYKAATTPESWRKADPPQVVQAWLNELDELGEGALYPFRSPVELLRYFAQHVMNRKRASDPSPPYSPRYFGKSTGSLAESSGRGKRSGTERPRMRIRAHAALRKIA